MHLGVLGLGRAELSMFGEGGRQPAHARHERRLEPRPQRKRRALSQVIEARQIEVDLRDQNFDSSRPERTFGAISDTELNVNAFDSKPRRCERFQRCQMFQRCDLCQRCEHFQKSQHRWFNRAGERKRL